MARAFIGMGANVDPEANILRALGLLSSRARVVGVSTFYRTPAEGRPEQPDYVNGVVAIETELPPRELKEGVLEGIEARLGRRRTGDKFAARPIDLDLLLYEDLVVDEPGLALPPPDIERRPFVAIPLAELAPERILPGTDLLLRDVAAKWSGARMEPLPSLAAGALESRAE